ncbi:MAG: hypothetical protein SNJ74_04885 [Fimbriimonadaceae bacterium]
MNDTAKKVGLIAIIVLALGAVAFTAYNASQADRMQVTGEIIQAPPGHKSEKERALEAQQAAEAAGTYQPPVIRDDSDLGDVGTGGGGGGKR